MSSSDTSVLNKRQAIVTGAAQGLGLTLSRMLTEQGYDVWATDVRPIPDTLRVAHKAFLDVSSPDSVDSLFAEVEAAGGVDALVNNAAIFPLSPWDELDVEVWRKTIDVNLTGSFLCARAAGLSMRRHGRGGAIVNITSLTFFKGIASGANYAASKGGVVGLTRSFARAFGPFGVRVNAVGPGLMSTEGVQEQARLGQFPATRLGETDDDRVLPGRTTTAGVASTVAFLLSDQAREVTGQVLVADGGTIFI